MTSLQRKRTAHIEVHLAVPLCLNLVDEKQELLQILEYNLRSHWRAYIVLGVDIPAVFRTHVTTLNTYEGSVVALYASYEPVVCTTVYIVSMSL